MRLFTGISLPAPVHEAIALTLARLRKTANLNWPPGANWHITLKFIGEWPEERLEELETALEQVPVPSPFPVRIARFGFFPNPHHPHTFFTGVQQGPELNALAAAVDRVTATLGVPTEARPFAPHLTLARIKNQSIQELRKAIASEPVPDFGSFHVEDFHLYRSQPSGGRSAYTILKTYPLEGKQAHA